MGGRGEGEGRGAHRHGSVLDRVVEEPRHDRVDVHPLFREQHGDGDRVGHVRLPALAPLPLVRARGVVERGIDRPPLLLRQVARRVVERRDARRRRRVRGQLDGKVLLELLLDRRVVGAAEAVDERTRRVVEEEVGGGGARRHGGARRRRGGARAAEHGEAGGGGDEGEEEEEEGEAAVERDGRARAAARRAAALEGDGEAPVGDRDADRGEPLFRWDPLVLHLDQVAPAGEQLRLGGRALARERGGDRFGRAARQARVGRDGRGARAAGERAEEGRAARHGRGVVHRVVVLAERRQALIEGHFSATQGRFCGD